MSTHRQTKCDGCGAWLRLLWLLLLALLACGCAAAPHELPRHVYVHPGTPAAVVDDARASVADWNAAVGVDVLVWHEAGTPDVADCTSVVISVGGALTHRSAATTDQRFPCWTSVNLQTRGWWPTTIRHELGHVLGLDDGHTFTELEREAQTQPASIMDRLTLWREITPADGAAVRAHWDIPSPAPARDDA